MKFCSQIKLLLWKNFTLRKRHTARNVIEILWPLVLFFILVAVRTRRQPATIQNVYYRPRAMPSAGLIPFMQSFLCDFKGTGLNYSDAIQSDLPNLQNSSFVRFLEDAFPLIQNSTLRDRVLRLGQDYQKYVGDEREWMNLWNQYQNLNNVTNMLLKNALKDAPGFQEFLINQTGISPQVAQELLNAKLDQQQVGRLVEVFNIPNILAGGAGMLAGLMSILQNRDSNQAIQWALANYQLVQRILQGQSLTGNEVKRLLCDDNSPVAIDNLIQLSQGNLTEVKTAICSLDNAKLQNLAIELRKQLKVPTLPNATAGLNLLEIQRRLTKDLQDLNQDAQALIPFEKLLSDYVDVSRILASGGNFNDLVCSGRWRRRSNSSSPRRQQSMPSGWSLGAAATAAQNSTGLRCLYNVRTFYPKYLKQLDNKTAAKTLDQCALIDPNARVDCGWPGMKPSECIKMGCCFDSSVDNSYYCFYKPRKAECGCLVGLATLSASGVSGQTQRAAFDRGFVQLAQLFLKGEILYTPDNPTTRDIINKVKSELSDIGLIEQFAAWWVNNSDTIRENVMNASQIYQNVMELYRNISTNITDREDLRNLTRFFNNGMLSYSNLERLANMSAMIPSLANGNNSMDFNLLFDSIDNVFREVVSVYKCIQHEYFVGYPDEDTLVRRALNTSETPVIASLVFENLNDGKMPKHVKYKIRQDIDYTPRTDRIRGWYWRPGPREGFGSNGYLNFGFLFLQDLFDRALSSAMLNETIFEPGVYLQPFPYPCYISDRFVWYISGPMPLLMTLAWIYSVAMIIKGIVYEKERRLTEVMKVMGLGRTVHWCAWFINSSVIMLITIFLLVITMKYGKILQNSDAFIVIIFLVVFMISTIMMCFLISVFFSRANVAAACGGIIFFVTYLPYSLVRWYEAFMTTSEKAVACLSSTTAFGVACSYFARYEEQGVGIQWSNFYSSPIEGDGFSLGYALTMMMVDAVLYGILTWYIEAVRPGQYGIAKPWYFPFLKSYWFPDNQNSGQHSSHSSNSTTRSQSGQSGSCFPRNMASGMDEVSFHNEDQTNEDVAVESEPSHLPLGVSIRGLVKIYKEGNKLAVDGLNLNLYEGQITSFLGHNGAGKTTTMSILTGLYAPTSGTAMISGKDIRSDIDVIRKSLGMCPQYNVLFDQLTVEEHLWFYSSLKGMKKSNIPAEIEKFLKDIGLEHKRHELAACLSGGMKRKLSVAMAFIAGSKVVILDEPTAGVDPYARRGIWDLLLKYKEGRTILLSTHHMDEADVLGDRVAIISQGKLQCCGSSLFLKGHYGNGYYLTLTKRTPGERPSTAGTIRDVKLKLEDLTETNSSSTDEGVFLDSVDAGSERDSLGSSNSDPLPASDTDVYCSENNVSSFIKKHIPTAQLVEHVGSELTYVLPTEAAKEGKFQDMFDDLDKNLGRLHVGSYGVSDTTLEEVFLKVAEDAMDEEADKFAAEVPKRRFSFRQHLFTKARVRDSLSDKCDLLDCMEEENPENELESPVDAVDGNDVDGTFDHDQKSTGLKLLFRQFWALLVKRFHHSRRNRKAFVSQIILPAVFVCIAMIVAQIRPFFEMPPIELTTKMFQEYEPYTHYMMFSNDDPKDPMAKNLTDTFLNYPGIGTACINGSCPKYPINFKGGLTPPSNITPDCSCATGMPVCPAGAGGPTPQHWKSYSGDILQNMTRRNVADHLLKTYHDYVKKRYGVVTFGDNFRNLPDNIRLAQDPATKRLVTARNTKAWYNNKGYHAVPTFLNVLSNNILRAKAKEKGYNPTQFGISITNHPMNYTREQLNDQTIIKRAVDVLVAICVVFALSFVPASFVVFLVNERATKGKHLHLVSGVRPYVYWIANYVWDMCNYLIPAFLCVLIFLAFNDESYTSAMNFPPTLCLLLLYGWAITPLMYPASYLFTVSSTAYIVLICLNLFIGVNCTLATFILELFEDDKELMDINDWLKAIFLVFPNYCLGRGLIDLAKNQFLGIFDRFGQNLVRPAFSWDITGRNIFAMIIQGFVFFTINVLIEYRFFVKPKPIQNTNNQLTEEDDDVKRERQRVVNGTGSCTDAMRLVNLTKIFKVRKKTNVAVNKLCVGVSKGECFGLLGVNGAGKTTTFKMLTGDIPVTSGEAYVNGYSVLSDIHAAHQTMGYCPQFDALDELLTAKEHLYLYSRLRGVPEDDIENVVKNLIQKMNLTQYQDVCAGKYSGGNKRKLSTAIALVGNPAIIFMDEPTTGMDPKARRFLWNIITGIVKEGRTVILTSHSMEECEALCNRVAIMVNGQFKCLGSPQHLKNKYGDGYTVVLRVAGPNPQTEQVSEFIMTVFPNAILKDKHQNMLEYQIPSQGLSVSKLFGHLEANRKIFNIEDYSVSQTTLDQVFINFAKDQNDGMDELQVNRSHQHNIELTTMRYTHLIDGDGSELTVNV